MSTTAQQRPAEAAKDKSGTPDSSFLYPVHPDLLAIEGILNEEIRSDVRAAYEISGHTLRAGGKRIRPSAVVLASRAVRNQFPTRTVYASAAAVELIHMASLIHDDVVDEAESRRGRPTANASFGNQISVLVGDYLLAKSIYLAAREGNMDVIRIFSQVTVGLSEGEVLQIMSRGNPDTSEQTYFDIIRRKTAGFIAGCCEIGAVLAQGGEDAVAALTAYGLNLGLAFQIADDILDFLGDPQVTGKPRCSDVREGKMTLPLIAACRRLPASSGIRLQLAQWFQEPEGLTEEQALQVCAFVEEHDGFDYARRAAADLVDKARQEIEAVLPPSPYRDSLAALAGYAMGRNH